MSYQPHLHKGGELYHARTFGSKNGISNTPGYRAKGRKAVGRFVGVDAQGHPIYDYSQRNPAPNQRYQQQQRINAAVATNAGAKGQSARELRERRSNANMANARRQDIANYNSRESQQKRADANIANARRQDIANYNSLGARLNRTGKQIGNWLNERGSRASNFISNIAKRARTAIGDARTAIGNAWDGKAGKGSALDDYNDRMAKSKNARTKSGAAALRKGAENAKSAYDRSIVGRFNAAREWMGGAAYRARTAIGNAWDGKAGKGSAWDDYNDRLTKSVAARTKSGAAALRKGAENAKQAYEQSIKGRIEKAGRDISKWAGDRATDVANATRPARSSASNAARTLTTKGPIQVGKNVASNVGGREAQQAKGDKARVKAVKEHRQRAERNWEAAQNEYARLNDAVNNATNERERNNAYAELDKFVRETYRPAQTDYNNTHKNRK